jgi:flagellar assembly factor FliW
MSTAGETELDLPIPCDQDQIHLPLGLLGFEQFKEYVWLQRPEEAPFCWLQARQCPSLAFLVVAPAEVMTSYAPDISEEDAAFLKLSSPSDACIYGIVTLRAHGRATVNLKGPIVLNRFTLRGKQVVPVNAADFPLQYPLIGGS